MPDIAFWNKCDNSCVMCTNPPSFALQDGAQYRLKGQIEKLERYLKGGGPVYAKDSGGVPYLSLTGGEPTLHPEFFQLLAYFRRRLPGVPITLLSNGRRFSDLKFAKRFAAAARPPFSVGVALHGPSAKVHDAVAGARGAFAQTVSGLANLLALGGPALEIRIILHKKTVASFPAALRFLLRKFPDAGRYRVTVIHYEIEGMSEANHDAVALRFSGSSAALSAALPLIRRFPELRLYHFPLCQVRAELRPLCRVTLPREERVYPAVCRRCSARKDCVGLMREYRKKFGSSELKALRR
jgi:MoaA/NifB/PqqE/SkfB family radical SAM enzyme